MSSASQILDIAERRMREAGYNAVSFRDIAAEIGMKSASLHYHFPKKEDLGVALIKRYTERFRLELDKRVKTKTDPIENIHAFIEMYRYGVAEQNLVCLCAVLGAEASGLPAPITAKVREFFERNIDWLTAQYTAMKGESARSRAKATLSALEGAMIISLVNEDMSVFEASAQMVLNDVKNDYS